MFFCKSLYGGNKDKEEETRLCAILILLHCLGTIHLASHYESANQHFTLLGHNPLIMQFKLFQNACNFHVLVHDLTQIYKWLKAA